MFPIHLCQKFLSLSGIDFHHLSSYQVLWFPFVNFIIQWQQQKRKSGGGEASFLNVAMSGIIRIRCWQLYLKFEEETQNTY